MAISVIQTNKEHSGEGLGKDKYGRQVHGYGPMQSELPLLCEKVNLESTLSIWGPIFQNVSQFLGK